MKGILTEEEFFVKTASILEAEGRYQDAIDCIQSTPSKEGFCEKNTSHISFLHLMLKDYEGARSCCRKLLEKHSFDFSFQAEIINYEFAKRCIGKKPSASRLQSIADNPNSKSVKGVALLLLGKTDDAYEILEKESRKQFSELDNFLRWPVLGDIQGRLIGLRTDLYNTRRLSDWKFGGEKIIDI